MGKEGSGVVDKKDETAPVMKKGSMDLDLHVHNIKGEQFEVEQLGKHTLVHVPRFAPADQTLLDVQVTIAPCNYDLYGWQCKSRFIESVNISGLALGEKKSIHLTAGKLTEPPEFLVARTGDGEVRHHQDVLQLESINLHSSTYGNVTLDALQTDEGHGFKVHLGDTATVHVQSKTHKERTDVHWLNVNIRGLRFLGDEIGGLLGFDDHSAASEIPEDCPGLQEKAKWQKTGTMSVNFGHIRNHYHSVEPFAASEMKAFLVDQAGPSASSCPTFPADDKEPVLG